MEVMLAAMQRTVNNEAEGRLKRRVREATALSKSPCLTGAD